VALITAAGGLVWRPGSRDGGDASVCIVHRPRYDDWSLPKGKVERGEHPLAAAVREVAEETGVCAVPRLSLPRARYRLAGTPKLVRYWAMSVAGPGEPAFLPNSEVDRLSWLPVAAAVARLTYPHDVRLVRDWAAGPPVTAVVLLVRHAGAGSRVDQPAADHARPLSERGSADAAAMAELLKLFAPGRLVSASPRRCRQTLQPLAAATGGLPIEVETAFDEATGDPAAATEALRGIAAGGATTVVCSQGAVIPKVLGRLVGTAADWRTAKGDGWLVAFAGTRPLTPAPLDVQRVRQ
jgi:8-oxo-dGTP diphosphatase